MRCPYHNINNSRVPKGARLFCLGPPGLGTRRPIQSRSFASPRSGLYSVVLPALTFPTLRVLRSVRSASESSLPEHVLLSNGKMINCCRTKMQ